MRIPKQTRSVSRKPVTSWVPSSEGVMPSYCSGCQCFYVDTYYPAGHVLNFGPTPYTCTCVSVPQFSGAGPRLSRTLGLGHLSRGAGNCRAGEILVRAITICDRRSCWSSQLPTTGGTVMLLPKQSPSVLHNRTTACAHAQNGAGELLPAVATPVTLTAATTVLHVLNARVCLSLRT